MVRYFRQISLKKKQTEVCFLHHGARSRDRTGTALLPLVFETSASTNSAIRALFSLQSAVSSQQFYPVSAGWRIGTAVGPASGNVRLTISGDSCAVDYSGEQSLHQSFDLVNL